MDEITWRETDREEALEFYAQRRAVEYRYKNGSDWLPPSGLVEVYRDPSFTHWRVDASVQKLVESNKTIRYDWHNKDSSVDVDRMLFETEDDALGNLHHSLSDGAVEGEEYIIYKITYEPVKRLRVKINTTLEEIQ